MPIDKEFRGKVFGKIRERQNESILEFGSGMMEFHHRQLRQIRQDWQTWLWGPEPLVSG
jgi:hypothetical protein